MTRITLNSGVVIEGSIIDTRKAKGDRLAATVMVVETPYVRKKYIRADFSTTQDVNNVGTSRIIYASDKAKYVEKKENTVVTIFDDTIREIREL